MGAIVSPQAATAPRGVVCLSRVVAVYGDWLSTRIPAALFQFSPQSLHPQSLLMSLSSILSPFLPEIYFIWLSPLAVNLVTLHSAVRLKHHRDRAEFLLGSELLFPLRLLLFGGKWAA